MKLIVGDVGGTNARLALLSAKGGQLQILEEHTFRSCRYESLVDLLVMFQKSWSHPASCKHACLGIAGPVFGNSCIATNLPWQVDGDATARRLGLDRLTLLNDLEATGWGLAGLDSAQYVMLQQGAPRASGNRALIAPGTGLGEAALFWDGDRHHPFATEGGHTDFAPGTEEQVELWRFLARTYEHLSWERVLSGPGIVTLFRFFLERTGQKPPAWFLEESQQQKLSAAITQRGLANSCDLCSRTLHLFFELLGAEAGNLALKTMATGGVYLAGGILPKVLSGLRESTFLTSFAAKGRFRSLLESMPVALVLDDRLGLWGAASRALEDTSFGC